MVALAPRSAPLRRLGRPGRWRRSGCRRPSRPKPRSEAGAAARRGPPRTSGRAAGPHRGRRAPNLRRCPAALRCRARSEISHGWWSSRSSSPRIGAEAHPPPAGLEPEQPASRRRDADGAAAVGGMGCGQHSRGHRRRRPAAGAARAAGGVQRVGARAEQSRLSSGGQTELGRAGSAHQHQAGGAIAAHHLRVVVVCGGRRRSSATRGWPPCLAWRSAGL